MNKILSFLLALFFVPLFSAVADVSCPSGYTTVAEDVVYVSSDNTCPSGHTKLGGEYGADTILNCTTAQSENESICTYFAEQCPAGKYFNGTSYQTCLAGSYCDGSGIATPGLSGCSQTCPSNSSSQPGATSAADCICNDGYYINNGVCETCPAGYACSGGKMTRCEYGTYAGTGQSTCSSCPTAVDLFDGKAMINSTGETATDFRDIDGDGLYKSVDECGVSYFVDDDYGTGYAFCTYNVSSEIYDKNCFGYPIGCAAGRYADEENAEYILESYYPVTKISSDKISDYTSILCSPVGENYWSPGILADYSNILDTLKRYSCPSNSSTNGSITATSCTCNDGYTLTGTLGGNIQTTTDVCRPIPEFTIITTDMSANTEFSFKISAAGIYTIDWGDGNVESIVKTDTDNTTYSHIYETAGVRTIGIGGDATEYNESDYEPAISFENNKNIAKLVGSLGSIFSGSTTSMFHGTFNQCTSLTEIPKILFDGVSGGALGMFAYTFSNCTSLTEIPSELFDGVSGGAESMFMYTFANCKSLTEIPEGLFNGITDNANNQFYATFMSCSSLEMIPSGLFKNITGKPVENEFMGTFYGCVKLSGYVPIDMFKKMDNTSYVSGPMSAIFYGTNIAEQCPENMYQYKTGFEVDWSGKVACSPCPDGYITDGPGATDISQCYIPCEKQCVRQTCPDNALNCTHGTEVFTGKQHYGETCNAKETACTISFTCPDGYTKSGLAQWAINNMDLLIDSETVLPMCGLDGLGSCDELKPGEWESYYEDGLPIKSATGVAVCNSVPGDDSTFDARINKDADFDLNTTGNYCWMKVQTVNDSFLPASWVYGWQYDTPEQCADDCGWSHNDNFQTVELAIVWGAEYDTCIANEYTVTYDCNGGTGNTTDTVTYNTTFTPRTDVCERDGHQFLGWTLNGASVSDSFVWNTTDNQTLVATWKQLSAECASGEYLPANTATCVPCKENNYCPGGKYDVSDTDTGINPCPENSSSQSGTTYCTCYDGYTVSGSVDGITQTTTTACKFVPKFSITTVPMSAGQEFKFSLTAAGTFYIDCGTGGIPIGATTVLGNVGTIVRNSARNDGLYDVYSCRYDIAGSHTIRMSGNATAYTTHFTNSRYDEESMATVGAYYKGAIYFNANKLIKEIHGSLGQIFSTLDNGAQPSFYLAFEEQSNMTGQIPAELFSGVHGEPIAGMFGSLFEDCSSLQGIIPKDLFKDIKGKPAPGVFASTFAGCSSLQGPIPSELFVNIKGDPASHMFAWTFGDCTNLSGSIDRNLFSGISGSAAEGMFIGTFYNCSNLTGGIDQDLFKNIVGAPQPYMFAQTFFGCERLSGGLPVNLFGGINGAPAEAMYVGTFAFCSGLDGNIPEILFGTIKGDAAPNMYYGVFMDDSGLYGEIPAGVFGDISGKPQYDSFGYAFNGCSSLTGSVPIDMFKNIDNTSYVSGPMYGMFNDTGLVTQCPENMYQYKTGFEVDWSDRVACTPCPNDGISPTGSTDITQCYIIKPCGQYTDITTTCYYNTESNDYTNCAECAVDSSCPYNQELVNGKCAPCNRDNAINYHETGNCMVSECEPGYQPYMQQCMPDKISCDAPNAEIAYQYWSIESRAYGPCIISKCVSGYNIEANACVPDVQPCELEHGTGTKTYNHDTGTWSKCIASECEPGYTTDSMLTDDALDGQCGRCSNMFVDNDLAVSTYVSGCEIATCMYQGEKYILENNECRMICSELHDDTGDRYWNGKKCVQKCKDGYSMW